jgi:4-hydroxy-tetrahydrodipicolinate synthase
VSRPTAFRGVWVPALTPFNEDLSVNADAFVGHCRWLLDQGADGLAVFGTTSEANSLSGAERMALLEALINAGVPASRLMPGVGCCALPDTVQLCRHAAAQGCQAVLMLPPFYYKGVSDDGLFEAFSRVIDEVGENGPGVFLYHIPPVAQIAISPELVARLVAAHPGRIAGIKDSGGDWGHTRALLERFPDLAVFAGSERFLLDTLRHGGAGCITASGNINPAGIRLVFRSWDQDPQEGDAEQGRITVLRDSLEKFKMIPALKTVCARHYRDDSWLTVRPPLDGLPARDRDVLLRELDGLEFAMAENERFVSRGR